MYPSVPAVATARAVSTGGPRYYSSSASVAMKKVPVVSNISGRRVVNSLRVKVLISPSVKISKLVLYIFLPNSYPPKVGRSLTQQGLPSK